MRLSIADSPGDSPTPENAGKPVRPKNKMWLRWFRAAVAIAVAVATYLTIKNASSQFVEQQFNLANIDFVVVAAAVFNYVAAMSLSCLFWFAVLKALKCPVSFARVVTAFFVSQLGKYVPGKAMVVVIRTDLIRDDQVSISAAAASVFVETLTWIFVGSVIACGLIFIQYPEQHVLKWTALALALAAGIITLPAIFQRLASLVTGQNLEIFSGLDFKTMACGWLLMTLGWLFNALSMYFVIASIPGTNICWADFDLTLACVTLATVAGFVSLLPGGLGVRELVMLPLLGPRFGVPTAMIVAVTVRLVWISAELLASGIIYGVLHRREP